MTRSSSNKDEDEDVSSSSDSSDWEEVTNFDDNNQTEVEYIKARLENRISANEPAGNFEKNEDGGSAPVVLKESLKIVIPHPNGHLKRKKKNAADPIGNFIVREINKCKREVHLDLHRVGLLCLLARALQYNSILRDESILGAALSILPSERSYPPRNLDLGYIEKFLSWFKRTIKLDIGNNMDDLVPAPFNLLPKLLEQMGNKKVMSPTFFVFIFVAILRALGVQIRLVMNLVPPPIKPHANDLMKLLKSENNETEEHQPSTSKGVKTVVEGNSKTYVAVTKSSKLSEFKPMTVLSTTPVSSKQAKRLKKSENDSSEFEINYDELSSSDSETEPKRKVRKKRTTKDKQMTVASRKSAKRRAPDFKMGKKLSLKTENSGRNLKSNPKEDPFKEKTKVEYNFWAEVYLEEEEQWVSVDIIECKVLSDATLKVKATQPICYVIGLSNTGHVKDVTTRYSNRWWTSLGRQRDHEWWLESIRGFRGKRTPRDRLEDEFLREHLLSLPIPTTISAFKNHPLYVLRRHLLKFEAVYPPDIIPSGYMKEEPVYPRSSVHILYGRETWLRKAKVVRIGEKSYKVVKARPKYNRALGTTLRDELLELFGEWQTEDYQPPIAIDGKVPRNEFGNVDLYMPKMLPVGTVHLQLPTLMRVARKLNIDCVPAVVGFEFHATGSHPKFDGFVVCDEFKEILLDAWNQEQDEIKKREEEKRLKRIYDRWEVLCKGLLIREKLEKRYAYNFSKGSGSKSISATKQKN